MAHGGVADQVAPLEGQMAAVSLQSRPGEAQPAELSQGASWDRLYVSNLPRGVAEAEVHSLFAPYGQLREVQVTPSRVRRHHTGQFIFNSSPCGTTCLYARFQQTIPTIQSERVFSSRIEPLSFPAGLAPCRRPGQGQRVRELCACARGQGMHPLPPCYPSHAFTSGKSCQIPSIYFHPICLYSRPELYASL